MTIMGVLYTWGLTNLAVHHCRSRLLISYYEQLSKLKTAAFARFELPPKTPILSSTDTGIFHSPIRGLNRQDPRTRTILARTPRHAQANPKSQCQSMPHTHSFKIKTVSKSPTPWCFFSSLPISNEASWPSITDPTRPDPTKPTLQFPQLNSAKTETT